MAIPKLANEGNITSYAIQHVLKAKAERFLSRWSIPRQPGEDSLRL
jgi:hypothetical protein